MIYHIYRSYNALAKYYYKPIIIDADPDEYKEAYRRSVLMETDERKLAAIQDFEISHIGTFEDNDGIIKLDEEPELILVVRDLIEERSQNGREETRETREKA